MPSSSTGKSSQEGRLMYFYQVAFARLHFSNLRRERDFIKRKFEEMLDLPDDVFEAEFCDDEKWWNDMESYCLGKRRHENCWAAGTALADAGACLFEFGRDEEAADCCQLAEDLHARAIDLNGQLGG